MYVFHYDPQTLAYTGGTPADFCQLEPGTVIVPAWASKTPPPSWNSAVEHPYYLPDKDAWRVRPLPPMPVEEPPAADAEVLDGVEQMKQALEAHLRAASEIIETMKGAA
jgi:hypothetical protein